MHVNFNSLYILKTMCLELIYFKVSRNFCYLLNSMFLKADLKLNISLNKS